MSIKFILTSLLIQMALSQSDIESSTKEQTKSLVLTPMNYVYTILETKQSKDTVVGILILAILFAFAYITGRSGHRLLQSQIDQQLTEIRQTEDDNQLTDEKEIAKALEHKSAKYNDSIIDTNELHLPDGFSMLHKS